MKSVFASTVLILCATTLSGGGHAADDLSSLKGPYLGQVPPGMTAKAFAPGIVNTEDWGDAGSFSPDMNEFFVSRWRWRNDRSERVAVLFRRVGDGWVEEALAEGARKPFFAPDGKTQHFGAKYKERTSDGWSEMKSLGPAFEAIRIMGLSAAADGMLVLDERGSSEGDGILRYSRLVNGKHEDPKPLPKAINTGTWNAHPFIAPDASYIMWDGERESGFGSSDLYISFRQEDGSWGDAINMGDKVNTAAEEGGPQVTPDGRFLLFNRMVPGPAGSSDAQSDLYWIDAQIIEDLRPE